MICMGTMYTKFDEEAHDSLVFIMLTRLFPYIMTIVTLTFDLQNQ